MAHKRTMRETHGRRGSERAATAHAEDSVPQRATMVGRTVEHQKSARQIAGTRLASTIARGASGHSVTAWPSELRPVHAGDVRATGAPPAKSGQCPQQVLCVGHRGKDVALVVVADIVLPIAATPEASNVKLREPLPLQRCRSKPIINCVGTSCATLAKNKAACALVTSCVERGR